MSSLQAFYSGAFSGTAGATPTLGQVLATPSGNIASTDINMNQNDLTNVALIQNTIDSITISAPQGIKLNDSAGTSGQYLGSNAFSQPTWKTIGGVGTENQVLKLNSSLVPVWATPSTTGLTVTWDDSYPVTPMPNVTDPFTQAFGVPILPLTSLATGYYQVSFTCRFTDNTGANRTLDALSVAISTSNVSSTIYTYYLHNFNGTTTQQDYNPSFIFKNPTVNNYNLYLSGSVTGSTSLSECSVTASYISLIKIAEL